MFELTVGALGMFGLAWISFFVVWGSCGKVYGSVLVPMIVGDSFNRCSHKYKILCIIIHFHDSAVNKFLMFLCV